MVSSLQSSGRKPHSQFMRPFRRPLRSSFTSNPERSSCVLNNYTYKRFSPLTRPPFAPLRPNSPKRFIPQHIHSNSLSTLSARTKNVHTRTHREIPCTLDAPRSTRDHPRECITAKTTPLHFSVANISSIKSARDEQ